MLFELLRELIKKVSTAVEFIVVLLCSIIIVVLLCQCSDTFTLTKV